MDVERPHDDREQVRRRVRCRALANLGAGILIEAAHSAGRLSVEPCARDALLLRFRDVRTLVGREQLGIAARECAVLLAFPPEWPFDRAAALRPFILAPDDLRHPNKHGPLLCIDVAGVMPEVLPGLIYDNLRLARFRLDDVLDLVAAGFVRANRHLFPCDDRVLLAGEEAP